MTTAERRYIKWTRMLDAIGMSYGNNSSGYGDMYWIHPRRSDGCQIGRISIIKDKYFIKWYKRGYHTELDDSDYWMVKIAIYRHTGYIMLDSDYHSMVERAYKAQRDDFKKKLAWRMANPPKGHRRRKKISGRNPRLLLYEQTARFIQGIAVREGGLTS